MAQVNEQAKQIRGPVPFWFLNGEVTAKDIELEFELMHEKGVREVIVHPRYGLNAVYLSNEWFEIFSWCLHEARKRNMYLWIYDELNWPSGTAGMTVQHLDQAFMGKYLHIEMTPKSEIDTLIFQPGHFLVAGKYQGGKITKTRQLDTLDQIRALDNNWLVFNATIKRDPFYIDTLSKPAVDCFKRHTYDEYYKRFGHEFGRTIRAIFTDEPSIYWVSVGYDDWNLPYTEKLFTSFSDRYKYSAVPMIPYLFYYGHAAPAFRADFWEHVSNLFNENYHGNLGGWCRRHNLIYTGHNNHEEPLRYQIRFQGNMFGTMKQEGIPGVDHLGKETLGNKWISIIGHKIASSVAHSQRKSRVMSESFGLMDWDTTYLDMKKVVDWQFAQGINLLVPHAAYHTIGGMTKRESPPSFFYQSPHWDNFGEFYQYVDRLQEALTPGKHVCRIVMLYPLTGLWSTYQPDRKTQEFEHMDNFLNSLCIELLQNQLDFDLIDYDTLKGASFEDGKILLGDESYDVLLVPSTFYMRPDEYETIDKISKSGVMTHFFLRQMDTDEASTPQGASKVKFHSTGDLSNFVMRLKQQLDDDVQIMGQGKEDILLLTREVDGTRVYFMVNRSAEPRDLTLRMKNCPTVYAQRPEDGSTFVLELKSTGGGKCQSELHLDPYQSVILSASQQAELGLSLEKAVSGEGSPVEMKELTVEAPYNVASLFNFVYRKSASDQGEDVDVRINPRFMPCNWDPNSYDFTQYAGTYEAVLRVDSVPPKAKLVLDKDYSECKVFLNDKPLELQKSMEGFTYEGSGPLSERLKDRILTDMQDLEVDVHKLLKTGKNTIRVESPTKLSEPVRLVGDFSVDLSRGKVRITNRKLEPFEPETSMPFFSGTVTYTTSFELKSVPSHLLLDLGEVKDSATVYLNGERVGTRLWGPFKFDLTSHAQKGSNALKIEVRNNMANLLLGTPRPFGLREKPNLRAYRSRKAK